MHIPRFNHPTGHLNVKRGSRMLYHQSSSSSGTSQTDSPLPKRQSHRISMAHTDGRRFCNDDYRTRRGRVQSVLAATQTGHERRSVRRRPRFPAGQSRTGWSSFVDASCAAPRCTLWSFSTTSSPLPCALAEDDMVVARRRSNTQKLTISQVLIARRGILGGGSKKRQLARKYGTGSKAKVKILQTQTLGLRADNDIF
jgi:hypothetical protein